MNQKISIPFYVRYDEWTSGHSLSWIWESIIWLEELLVKLVWVSWINEESISVEVKEAKTWCILFWLDINLILAIQIFKDIKEFYDIVNFIQPNITDIWTDLISLHSVINDFASKNPVDYDIIKAIWWSSIFVWILKWFLNNLIKILPSQKQSISTSYLWYNIPTKIALKSNKLLKSNSFKKTLNPFIDWKIKSIDFWIDENFSNWTNINQTNFWNYLSEDQKILPEWENWDIKNITWKFVWWQIKKWKSLTFRVDWLNKKLRDLVCFPDENKDINDLTTYLSSEKLTLKVEINRISLYEKPRLIIHEINETILTLNI